MRCVMLTKRPPEGPLETDPWTRPGHCTDPAYLRTLARTSQTNDVLEDYSRGRRVARWPRPSYTSRRRTVTLPDIGRDNSHCTQGSGKSGADPLMVEGTGPGTRVGTATVRARLVRCSRKSCSKYRRLTAALRLR